MIGHRLKFASRVGVIDSKTTNDGNLKMVFYQIKVSGENGTIYVSIPLEKKSGSWEIKCAFIHNKDDEFIKSLNAEGEVTQDWSHIHKVK